MGFKTPDFPAVDPATFGSLPRMERYRQLAVHWGEYGFGTPKIVHTIYIAKLVFIHAFLGALLAQRCTGETALVLGTHLHGCAADACVAAGAGPVGLTAGELVGPARRTWNGWLAGR